MSQPSEPLGGKPFRYRQGPWRHFVVVFGVSHFGGLWCFLMREPPLNHSPMANSIIGAILLACAGVGLWFLVTTRVEISPEGIRTFVPGRSVYTPWSNVIGVRFDYDCEGFVTQEPLQGRGAAGLASHAGINIVDTNLPTHSMAVDALLVQRRYIMLDGFGWHFHHGDFLKQVARFAAHLA